MTAPNHNDLQRSLGRVEGTQEAMKLRMDGLEEVVKEGFKETGEGFHAVKQSVDELRKSIEKIEQRESERRGAWRVIVPVVTVLSSIVTWLAAYVADAFTKG